MGKMNKMGEKSSIFIDKISTGVSWAIHRGDYRDMSIKL